jgi:hypothetical protein
VEGEFVALLLEDNSGQPTKFHEAYKHPEPDTRVKWRLAICKGFEDMKDKEYEK